MSLSEKSNYDVYGSDIALEPSSFDNSANKQQSSTPQVSDKDIYIKKLMLSIRSLEAILKREKKKRRIKTIVIVSFVILFIAGFNADIPNIGYLIIYALSSLLMGAIYYGISALILYYPNKKNADDMIRIEKLKTELALLSNRKETTYDLNYYHDTIDSMEDWL